METALGLSGGVVVLDFVDLPETDPHRERMYLRAPGLPLRRPVLRGAGAAVVLVQLAVGRLPDCTGLGTRMEVDPDLVVSDPAKTLAEGAIGPWSGGHVSDYFMRLIEALGVAIGFGIDTPWSQAARRPRSGRSCSATATRCTSGTGTGTGGNARTTPTSRARSPTSSAQHCRGGERLQPGAVRRVHARGALPVVRGARLKPVALAVTVDGRSIAEICAAADRGAGQLLLGLDLSDRDRQIAGRILKEVNARLGFLLDVGLDYLTLDRASATLAGGRHSGSGWRPRSAPGWSVCCTCWTSRRSGCTSGTTTGCSRRCCGCATSATR